MYMFHGCQLLTLLTPSSHGSSSCDGTRSCSKLLLLLQGSLDGSRSCSKLLLLLQGSLA